MIAEILDFKNRSVLTPGRHACRPFPDIITPQVAHGMQTGAGVAPDAHGTDYYRNSVSRKNNSQTEKL